MPAAAGSALARPDAWQAGRARVVKECEIEKRTETGKQGLLVSNIGNEQRAGMPVAIVPVAGAGIGDAQ